MSLESAIDHLRQGDWQRAHEIVQQDESPLGCWAHGIVHMMEGDVGNARYWYRRAHRGFPATSDAAAELAALASAWKAQASAGDEA
jgi:hypothetical protein